MCYLFQKVRWFHQLVVWIGSFLGSPRTWFFAFFALIFFFLVVMIIVYYCLCALQYQANESVSNSRLNLIFRLINIFCWIKPELELVNRISSQEWPQYDYVLAYQTDGHYPMHNVVHKQTYCGWCHRNWSSGCNGASKHRGGSSNWRLCEAHDMYTILIMMHSTHGLTLFGTVCSCCALSCRMPWFILTTGVSPVSSEARNGVTGLNARLRK